MPPNEEAPEAERVDAGERDVTGADLQRHEVVGERRRHRHHEEEHHGGGVHREHLVVEAGAEHRAVGAGQLQADEQRLDAADEEEEHRHDAVHDAELLVVDREHPRLQPVVDDRTPEDADTPATGVTTAGAPAPASGRAAEGRSMMAIWVLPSLPLEEVGDELVDLGLVEAEVRHAADLAAAGRPSVRRSAYIGFFAGALRIHSRRSDLVEALRR